MTRFTLGINLGFATNRFPEPDVWARLVSEEMGLHSVQLVADLLNPFWPDYVIDAEVERILKAVQRYHLDIHTLMSSTFTRYNYFLYPYPELRQAYQDWYKRFAVIASRLGARGIGSHFGTFTVSDYADPRIREARLSEAIRIWQENTFTAQDLGLQYLYIETMSIPRELADTIENARELLARMNEHSALPIYYCLDIGHAPHPSERDPYIWLRELGRDSRIVHLQQTEMGHSRHWPFTQRYNELGIIDPLRTLQTLSESGAEDILLAFEISHRERYEDEPLVIPELAASAHYWREYLPVDGEWQPGANCTTSTKEGAS
ncbi:MAG: sugar phosphate isomerase/epimerase family protein [Anaerolineae bacterium]